MSAVYIQFVPVEPSEGIAVPIRKWSMSPFEGGVAYAPVTPLTDAAPDLLAACHDALADAQEALMWAESSEIQGLLARCERLQAAIAKATQP